jgi:O-antigen/teichoic acid export membrane protein
VFLGANAGTLFWQVDQQLIINFLWPKDAGYYSNFFTLLGTYSIIVGPILTLLFPITTELITKNDTTKIRLLQNILYKYFSVFALSIWWLFFATGPMIACILFGTKFLPSWDLLRWIGPALIFNVLISINYSILAGRGLVKERVKILFIALIANILINVITILGLGRGLYGAVLALAGGWFVLRWLSYRTLHKNEAISFSRKYLWGNALVIWIMTASIRYVSPMIFTENDTFRYHNFLRFLGISIMYYIIIAAANYKSIQALIWEIKNIRK